MIRKEELQRDRPRSIDWDDVHKRLDSLQQAVEHFWVPGPEESRRILKERTELLAGEQIRSGEEERLTVVEFLLAYEHYAVEIVQVKEVFLIRELTFLPGTPPFVLGIINIRGEIFSIIDLRKVFNLPDQGLPECNTVLVMRDEKRKFCIVVDSMVGVKQIVCSALKPPPSTFIGTRAGYVRGITTDAVIVLDGDKILADQGLMVHEQE